jgi:hypothetical protein
MSPGQLSHTWVLTFQSAIYLETCGTIKETFADLVAVIDQRWCGNDSF